MSFRKAALSHLLSQAKPKAKTATPPSALAPVKLKNVAEPPIKASRPSDPPSFDQIHRNVVSVSNFETFVSKLVHESSSSTGHAFQDTVKDRTFYLDNIKIPRAKKESSKKRITSKSARQANLLTCPKSIPRSTALSLHSLWLDYATSTLSTSDAPQSLCSKVITLDYHGATVTVSRCKIQSLVGLRGILIQETKNLFRIARDDVSNDVMDIASVPKSESIFTLHVNNRNFKIFGQSILCRSAERSTKKFKNMRNTIL
ncbi:hypothetical protein GEMRC1_002116 [Eukaryota sp. GEM-RC1]